MAVEIIDIVNSAETADDAAQLVQDALEKARLSKKACIRFQPGTYHFRPDRASEKFYYVSNNDSSKKRIAFAVRDIDDLVIDGGGSEFIFHGKVTPFVLDNARNITIRNFNVDYQRTFFTQGRIAASGRGFVELEIDREAFPYRIENGRAVFYGDGWESDKIFHLLEIDAQTLRAAYGMSDDYTKNKLLSARETADGRLRLESAAMRYEYHVGQYLSINHEERWTPGFFLTQSENVVMEDINIYHAGAMAVIAQVTKDITLRRVNVAIREGSGRVVSAIADATHFVNCYGTVRLSQCLFENQLDDAANVHGIYTLITNRLSDREVEVEFIHYQQQGVPIYSTGDRIHFIDRQTMLPLSENTIRSVEWVNCRYTRIVFNQPLDSRVTAGCGVENIDKMPDLVIEGCRSGRNRARSFLISTRGKVLVEDNVLYPAGAAIKISGDVNYWYESGAVTDVTIRNNKFVNCNTGVGWGRSVIEIDPEVETTDKDAGYFHRNIRIHGNRFETFDTGLVYARSVQGLHIADNTVARTDEYEPFNDMQCQIHTEFCDDVVVADNELVNIRMDDYNEIHV